MAEETNSKLTYFLIGGGIGAVLALIFAPRTGQETRKIISEKTSDSREKLSSATRTASSKVLDYIDKSKELIDNQTSQISSAIDADKEGYPGRIKPAPESE
ncbi:MAG: YtxH domain-containing protein [Acidobacteriia bacterium]|nr:YtxH domain-containing protein [Terriglobia bacterium]